MPGNRGGGEQCKDRRRAEEPYAQTNRSDCRRRCGTVRVGMYYIRDNLAVCGFHHIGQRADFESHGFRVQLQCAEPYDPWLAECVQVMATPFADGAPIPKDLFNSAPDWLAGPFGPPAPRVESRAAAQNPA